MSILGEHKTENQHQKVYPIQKGGGLKFQYWAFANGFS